MFLFFLQLLINIRTDTVTKFSSSLAAEPRIVVMVSNHAIPAPDT